jgi:protein SCO1/2
MNPARIAAMLLLMAAALRCGAQPLALPPAPRASIEQKVGSQLPLDLAVTDASGVSGRLQDYFGTGVPVLLVAGYYRCPQLCGLLMQGLLDALHRSGLPRSRWRIVRFSIDPAETPADARARREFDLAYADFLLGADVPDHSLDLHLLTLAPAGIDRLADALGYRFEATDMQDNSSARFAHPATVAVLTPQGRISRYFNGVQFDSADLRLAIADAAGDRLGGVTSRLALLCAHFDPRVGHHSGSVMDALRALCVALAVGLGAWCWKRREPSQ